MTVYGTTGRRSSRKPPPSCQYHRTYPRTTGQPEAADAAVNSARAAVPFEELRAGRIRRMAMPEYTAARGRFDDATFREQADASVQCLGPRDFEPSFYTPVDRQGSGRVAND